MHSWYWCPDIRSSLRPRPVESRRQASRYHVAAIKLDRLTGGDDYDGKPGDEFYRLVSVGKQSEHWINLFGALDNAPDHVFEEHYFGAADIDDLVSRVESFVVDEYQRGVVDYYAGAYEVGIAAFERHIISNTLTISDTVQLAYKPDTHLFMGWSYEGLGNPEAAVAQFDAYAAYERAMELAPMANPAMISEKTGRPLVPGTASAATTARRPRRAGRRPRAASS